MKYNNFLDHAVVFLVMGLAWMVSFSGLYMVSEGSGNLGFKKSCLYRLATFTQRRGKSDFKNC